MTSTFNSLLPQINKKVRVRGFCPREIGSGTMAKKYPYHQGKVRRHAILAAKKERFEKKTASTEEHRDACASEAHPEIYKHRNSRTEVDETAVIWYQRSMLPRNATININMQREAQRRKAQG